MRNLAAAPAVLLAAVVAWGLVACETRPRMPAAGSPVAEAASASVRADVNRPANAPTASELVSPADGAGERERVLPPVLPIEGLVQDLGAIRTERGFVITLDDKLFGKGSAQLNPDVGAALEQIARYLVAHPERRVQIEAFTDGAGAASYNLELSQSRADVIAMLFIDGGIDAARVRALGYGEWFAAPQDAPRRGGPPDRRVEVIMSNDAGAIPVLLPITAGVP